MRRHGEDLSGQVWEREFALETTNILFIEEVDQEDFWASPAKQWRIMTTDASGNSIIKKMVVIPNELSLGGWKRLV
jgi:hypothetical protein